MKAGAVHARHHVAVFYATLSIYTGVRQPYWGMWLVSQGLSQEAAGAMATAYLVFESLAGVASGILLGNVHLRRGTVTACYLVLAGATALFLVFDGSAAILGLSVVAGFAFGCLYHAREVFWLEYCQANRQPYGTARMLASATFMVAALAGGGILGRLPPDALLPMILLALAAGLIWFRLKVRPEAAAASSRADGTAPRPGFRFSPAALRGVRELGPTYAAIVAVAGLVHSSQALFHLFSALHFNALGIGNGWVGIYWAVALLSEVTVFAIGQKIIDRRDPWGLMAVSALVTILRWSAMAVVTDRYGLLAVQLMHGFCSAGVPLAAGTLLIRTVPRERLSIAQGVLQLSTNACMGVMLIVSGITYGIFGGQAFLLMAAAGLPALLIGCWMMLATWSRATS
jgi:MFS transporter, PPP family, 3-phenylpropionic acid transporter